MYLRYPGLQQTAVLSQVVNFFPLTQQLELFQIRQGKESDRTVFRDLILAPPSSQISYRNIPDKR